VSDANQLCNIQQRICIGAPNATSTGEIMRKFVFLAAALAVASPAVAKDHQVKMLNKGAAGTMVFEPAMIRIAPGDTVTFVATNPSHNAESIPSMMPAGAVPFKGKLNKPVTAKFDKPGVYGIKCLPHYFMGMVALVQVGSKSPNLAQARAEGAKMPGLAKKRMAPLLASAK
jgi:pseudoazurin